MKTYNERLNLIAEEMANSIPELEKTALKFDITKDEFIKPFYTYAAIAIKHMAEAYRIAVDEDGAHRSIGLDEYIINLGLQPQTT